MTEAAWPLALALMGPTAAGKTDLAVSLVEHFPCEIISVDSVMIYRGMDIGSAKPGPELLARAPHRLIDILDPAEAYSAARFRQDALREMQAITAAGRIPLLVGGTMLYYRALLQGISVLPAADPALRQRLENWAREAGWEALHQRLAEVDPVAAQRIHPNDPQRTQRALEVYELTGIPLSTLQQQHSQAMLPYRFVKIALLPSQRRILHERIAQRFVHMLTLGLVDEVVALHARGDLHEGMPSVRAVGYRQVWDYLEGRLNYTEMQEKGIIATRQLAKRQLTWLRSEPELRIFDVLEPKTEQQLLKFVDSLPINRN